MDARHFDVVVRALSMSGSRRRLAALFMTVPVAGGLRDLLAPAQTAAKRHKKKKKKPTPTPTPACKPDPVAQICAGRCGVVSNNCQQLVDCGSCICDVRCNDTPTACGAALQATIDAAAEGDTLIICQGTYRGGFRISRSLTLIGAGQGEDPARNTILDGNNSQQVLNIPGNTGTVTLKRLTITRGAVGAGDGGGILHKGTRLIMRDCTVAGNHGRNGAGVVHQSGTLEMTRCTVRDNVAPTTAIAAATGGGLFIAGQATLTDCLIANNESANSAGGLYVVTAEPVILAGTTVVRDNKAMLGGGIFADNASLTIGVGCRVTGNTADPGDGGGIFRNGGMVTLEGPSPSPIVVDNCHENCSGDVPQCQSGGTCPA
jgi:hypothetical protein